MRKTIYVSFLGRGNYRPVRYRWEGYEGEETPYAQEAELSLAIKRKKISKDSLTVLILGTATSKKTHWDFCQGYSEKATTKGEAQDGTPLKPGLRPRLEALGLHCEFVDIDEELSAQTQWKTFQKLIERVPPESTLIMDMTHGFRAVPVVFSSALHFLRLTRKISLQHVLYAAHDTTPPEIFDYVDFYAIGDWTDAVSRLVEDADAAKLAELSKEESSLRIEGFGSEELTRALAKVTATVKNVDVHHVGGVVREALGEIEARRNKAQEIGDVTSQILLDLVRDKFASLMSSESLSGTYDEPYFKIQLAFVDVLLEHKLYMQAFTALREYIGSLGMYGYKDGMMNYESRKGRQKRRRYAEIFIQMVKRDRKEWAFHEDESKQVEEITPYYERLEKLGVTESLRDISEEITQIRNGFDHAWTSKRAVQENIGESGAHLLKELRAITDKVFASDAS